MMLDVGHILAAVFISLIGSLFTAFFSTILLSAQIKIDIGYLKRDAEKTDAIARDAQTKANAANIRIDNLERIKSD